MFSKVKGQEEQRRPETFVDQHGREYFANVELKTGDPCEVLQPRFKAPTEPAWFRKMLMPPVDDLAIVKMVPRLQRARKGYQVFIDYDAWLAKTDERDEEWDARLRDLARRMSGGLDVLNIVKNPPPELVHYIGRKSFPPRVLIEAMKAGNPWALGLSATVPAKAVALLADLESQITGRRRRQLGTAVADPLADDDEPVDLVKQAGFDAVTDLDPFGDIEEQADPTATGGKVQPIKPKRGRPKKQNTELPPAA